MSPNARDPRPYLTLAPPPPRAPLLQDVLTTMALSALLIAVAMMAGNAPLAVLAGAPLLWFARRAQRAVGARLLPMTPMPAARHRREG